MGAGELARALVGVALQIRARVAIYLWSQRRKWRDDYVVLGTPIGEFASGRQHHLESRGHHLLRINQLIQFPKRRNALVNQIVSSELYFNQCVVSCPILRR